MEYNFEKDNLQYLDIAAWETKRQEQTQEVKLPDGMPDVGRVLGCWGQPVLRSKEWRNGSMTAAGGVMTWTLYAPEDGSPVRSMEAWVPFQVKWDFPEQEREGTMNIACRLRSADARTVSPRKLMVRVSVSCQGIAAVPAEAAVYRPEQLPEDIRLLKRTYPMRIPREAGEKTIRLDEELMLPDSVSGAGAVVRFALHPEVMEQKLLTDRLVIRGTARLHLLLEIGEGRLRGEQMEIPFSQYTDLDRPCEGDGEVMMQLMPTSLETELDGEGRLRVKGELTAQYIIWERTMLDVVEDAYSPRRDVRIRQEDLELPAMLDDLRENVRCQSQIPGVSGQVVDAEFLPDQPDTRREGDTVNVEVPGRFQILYYDAQGSLQGANAQCQGDFQTRSDADVSMHGTAWSTQPPQVSPGGEGMSVRGDAAVQLRTISARGIPMVTGLEAGEAREEDPLRPSLILRKAGKQSLWELAKASGSTVEAIRNANALDDDPDEDKMLLIPVS